MPPPRIRGTPEKFVLGMQFHIPSTHYSDVAHQGMPLDRKEASLGRWASYGEP